MNYKLAKKLKDAGFEQKDKNQYPLYIKEYNEEPMQVPTLSELVEACGGGFYGLERCGGYFIAYDYEKDIEVDGDTPSEAIANLWIKLNKK